MPVTVHLRAHSTWADLSHEFRESTPDAARTGAVFLVANPLQANDLRQAWLERAGPSASAWSPRIETWDSLLAGFLEPIGDRIPSDWRIRLSIEAVAQVMGSRAELSRFDVTHESRGLLDGLMSVWEELRLSDTSTSTFLELCQGWDDSENVREFARLLQRTSQMLQQQQWLEPMLVSGVIRQRIARGELHGLGRLWVAGFADWNPALRAICEAVLDPAGELTIALPWDRFGAADWLATTFTANGWMVRRHEPKKSPMPRKPLAMHWLRERLFVRGVPQPIPGSGPIPGIEAIEAAGDEAEARLVARRLVEMLGSGVPAERIVITGRNLERHREMLRAEFAEYPLPMVNPEPVELIRSPAVRFLLRAMQASEEQFPFAEITAVLRSTYFRPNWPSCEGDPERPLQAESLLRRLGEPRDRAVYLRGVRRWIDDPPQMLEDEQAERYHWRRMQEMAKVCEPFLIEFFQLWDGLPDRPETLTNLVRWLERLVQRIGMFATLERGGFDDRAVRIWLAHLAEWADENPQLGRIDRLRFFQKARSIAMHATLEDRTGFQGRIRLVPVEQAVACECDVLVLMGLGEGSFPRIAPPNVLIDDAFRTRLGLPDAAGRLEQETTLFYRLVTRPMRTLVLSYSAVDPKGQALLPSSFLLQVHDCLGKDRIPTQSQRIRIDGFLSDRPLCAAEFRTQWALAYRQHQQRAKQSAHARRAISTAGLSPQLAAHLQEIERIETARFDPQTYSRYDGLMSPAVIGDLLEERFGPEKVLSPTALETYIQCPFRFGMGNALFLKPLEDPGERVEQTQRGSAFHRALARFHTELRDEQDQWFHLSELPEMLTERLQAKLDQAIADYTQRMGNPAARRLWELEGERLRRAVARYRDRWQKYLASCPATEAKPRPWAFELDFGQPTPAGQPPGAPALEIARDGNRVRLGGRIDRVDVADWDDAHGFTIIDYKTGSRAYYDDDDVHDFVKLQMPVYAMAMESILLTDRPAIPIGFLYWMLTDAKERNLVVPGKRQSVDRAQMQQHWRDVRGRLELTVLDLVGRIRDGDFRLQPRSEECASLCEFSQICRINQVRMLTKVRDGLNRKPLEEALRMRQS
ncbi:PD-(D/E)XK nuclease family protein [Tuwongella immobilis]|uniref:PD-(D/E)XK endonuclease-like domain-containing protein n=1 Tax=Tuwongella immobilis TaxID=692036 RepID=A0A6C2YLQ4_9BACT|nr:PD-(D/E)XK nuclease family protein [Tuwongella immobilis]VIP02510.1 atp-dependent nuclease subunit b-like protein : Uncharacterized protein OS=Singulisphaera acidiphila (strain ATCC BAA-1392 / DSM 18658 / VKM B-2454 / MOB10) GN=Sinac_5928 PE=4 SV=1: Exonuc_V_gamma: PDDEXK_1 [Tuwongella immobilis]VTS01619.1 atp-dependent nuclease subunit b-like protein : Uncharacterized protein OS=Singulisphaera acidiphila (strain ATCC BAA-1392 / DSM 18658 / VKM B-2454 / MOB10) GN=Sinac_5928 PE=4 SV=1: Exonuc_V